MLKLCENIFKITNRRRKWIIHSDIWPEFQQVIKVINIFSNRTRTRRGFVQPRCASLCFHMIKCLLILLVLILVTFLALGRSQDISSAVKQPLSITVKQSCQPTNHFNDVIMGAMASQISSLMIVLLNRLYRRRLKKASKPRVTGPCVGNSPVTGEFPEQRASNAENCFQMMTSTWTKQNEMMYLFIDGYRI